MAITDYVLGGDNPKAVVHPIDNFYYWSSAVQGNVDVETDWTKSTTGTHRLWQADNTLDDVGNNTIGIMHDSNTGAVWGFPIFGDNTNLYTDSDDLTGAWPEGWYAGGAGTRILPNGSSTGVNTAHSNYHGTEYREGDTDFRHIMEHYQISGLSSSETYTNTGVIQDLRTGSESGSRWYQIKMNVEVVWDMSDWSVESTGGTHYKTHQYDVGHSTGGQILGWTGQVGATAQYAAWVFSDRSDPSSGTQQYGAPKYTGDSDWRKGMYNMHLSQGYLQPCVPTSDATATRTKQQLYMTSVNTRVSAFGSDEFTWYFKGRHNGDDTQTTRTLVDIGDGTDSNRLHVWLDAAHNVHADIYSGGSNVAPLEDSAYVVPEDTEFYVAVRVDANNFAMSVNGRTVVTDSGGAFPSGTLSEWHIGQENDATNQMRGYIGAQIIWDVAKDNATLESIETLLGVQEVDVPHVSNSETVYTPDVSNATTPQDVTTPHVNNSETVYLPDITVGSVSVGVPHISSVGSVTSPDVTTGAVSIGVPHVGSSEVVQAPDANVGAVNVGAPHIGSTEAVYTPSVTTGDVNVSVPHIGNSESVFTPDVTTGAVTVGVPHITSVSATYGLDVSVGAATVDTPHVDNSETVYAPDLTTGAVSIGVPHISSESVVYGQTVTGEGAVVTPTVSNTNNVYTPDITVGSVSVGVPHVANTNSVYAPDAAAGSVDVGVPHIGSGENVYTPDVTADGGVSVPHVGNSSVVYTPDITTGAVTVGVPYVVNSGSVYGLTVTPGAVTVEAPFVAAGSVAYAPDVTASAPSVGVPHIASAAAVYALTITTGEVSITAPHVANSSSVYTPGVAAVGAGVLDGVYPVASETTGVLTQPGEFIGKVWSN